MCVSVFVFVLFCFFLNKTTVYLFLIVFDFSSKSEINKQKVTRHDEDGSSISVDVSPKELPALNTKNTQLSPLYSCLCHEQQFVNEVAL